MIMDNETNTEKFSLVKYRQIQVKTEFKRILNMGLELQIQAKVSYSCVELSHMHQYDMQIEQIDFNMHPSTNITPLQIKFILLYGDIQEGLCHTLVS
jgi:hypothetical protein